MVRKDRPDETHSKPTALKGARKKALQAADARYQRIANISPVGVFRSDLEGNLIDVNQPFLSMSGYLKEELVGKMNWKDLSVPEHRELDDQALAQLRTAGLCPPFEKQMLRKDRSPWPVLFGPVLADDSGADCTCFVLDQSEKTRRYKTLHEQMRHKDEFLAVLAHELRNPLAPILNGLELMRMVGLQDPTLEEVRTVMERQTRYLVRLVDDLLDVARITQGAIQLHKQPVALRTVIDRAIEMSRGLFEERGHEVTISIASEPMQLDADPIRLEQVLVNLLNNAAHYTEPGGHIWVTAEREGDQAVLTVKDTGLGIDPDMLPHIFDRFNHADRALKNSQGGLGIGLHLVRSLVSLHGGTVAAHSDGPGKGSEFSVRLPMATH